MIKLIIKVTVIALLFSVKTMYAQEFHGQAVYESKTKSKGLTMKINGMDADPAQMKAFQERMDKMNEVTFFLNFNKFESVYEEEQKLEAPTGKSGIMMVKSGGDKAKTYKNIKEKMSMVEEDFFGKEFLVTDSLPDWKWELQSETKKIGDYTCYKAVSIKRVTEKDMEEYNEEKKKQNEKTNFFVIEPKETITTVWYTPEIPVSQGPGNFWGLPGLILEASYDDTIILCSKIVLNPKNKTEIKKLKKGKKVSRAEYDKIMTKQFEQMKDGDGNIKIQIGG